MSKSVARIVFALVISLVIIAAIATTVQARLGSTSPGSDVASAAVIGRIGANERANSSLQQMEYFDSGQYYQEEGGGCDHSSSSDD